MENSNPIAERELQQLATDAELMVSARAVLQAGRPAFLSLLATLISLPGIVFSASESSLPIAIRIVLASLSAFVPYIVIELWLLRRRLQAALILLGLSREGL